MNSSGADFASNLRPRKNIRTLVVDDSPVATGAIRLLLERRREFELVGTASDGEEGVAYARRMHPDLVLMDLQMPKLDGLSATRLIRGYLPDTRIVVVTFMHGDQLRQECRNGGADGFVLKDRLYQDLFSEIDRVFHDSYRRIYAAI